MIRALNGDRPRPLAPEPDPVALSRQLLTTARRTEAPDRCDPLTELAVRLRAVDPGAIDGDGARLAFWINVYNALFLHRTRLRPIRGSVLLQLRLFSTVAYEVGERPYTLNLIEHGVLRRNRRPPYHLRRPFRRGDPRLAVAPATLDSRVHFALNCGARSCPPIQAYGSESVDEQLEQATRAYLRAETSVDRTRGRVVLPRLMRLYRADFGDREAQLGLAAAHVSAVSECLREGGGRAGVRYGSFDWTAVSSPPGEGQP